MELLRCGHGSDGDLPSADWSPTKCGKRADLYAKFHAAGREDIDVRMLGRGRPFIIEIMDSFYPPAQALDRLSAALAHKNGWNVSFDFLADPKPTQPGDNTQVELLQLQSCDRAYLQHLASSAESHEKTYCCVVWMKGRVTRRAVEEFNRQYSAQGLKELAL